MAWLQAESLARWRVLPPAQSSADEEAIAWPSASTASVDFVAKNEIVSRYIRQIYVILRSPVGEPIEFGLTVTSSGFAADSCSPPWPRTSSRGWIRDSARPQWMWIAANQAIR